MFLILEPFHLHEVVGTVEGGRAPTKIKTDVKKPVVNLACHPRLPALVNILLEIFLLSTRYLWKIVHASLSTLELMDAW